MYSFGVKNLRRLYDVEPVTLKPVTLLVGRNSSGKSTFLRALPLLRQSALTRTSSPILWFGDFVDFGSYEGAVSNNDIKKNISFRFGIDDFRLDSRRYYGYAGSFVIADTSEKRLGVTCDITLRLYKDTARLCLIELGTTEATKIVIHVEENGKISSLKTDGIECLQLFGGAEFSVSQGSLLPAVYTSIERSDTIERAMPHSEVRSAATYLATLYKPWLDKRLKEEALIALCARILLDNSFSESTLISLAEISDVKSFSKLLKDIATHDTHQLYSITRQVHKASQAIPILRGLSEQLRDFLSSIMYIGPARARSERYYRYQDLSVSEIDSDGKNFPMFLNSLRESQFKNLSTWVENLFGYRLELIRSTGHISINVAEGPSTTNIVDTGYGISQILPVLGQIWWSFNKPPDGRRPRGLRTPNLLVIEQPELHLHPAHQSLLADALVQVIGTSKQPSNKIGSYFIIETHSETLVNRIGRLIGEGKVNSGDVQVILFEPDEDEKERRTGVRIARFGESGELINWPYGFFQPGV